METAALSVLAAVFVLGGSSQATSRAVGPAYTCTDATRVDVPAAGVTICTGTTTSTDALASQGALVTAVQPDGAAASEGLIAGDLIYRIQDRDVSTAAQGADGLSTVNAASDLVVNFLRQGSIYLVRLRKR